jgi:hypothetical protein
MPLNPDQFAHFLYGFSETNQNPPTTEQWKVIQNHLNGIFNKVTPDRILYTGDGETVAGSIVATHTC